MAVDIQQKGQKVMSRAKDLLALIGQQNDRIATLSDQIAKLVSAQQTLSMRVTLLEGRQHAHTRLADIERELNRGFGETIPGEQPLMLVTYPDDKSVTMEHQAEYLDAPPM